MISSQDLLNIANELAGGLGDENRGRPRQTELRRAVSCAYYAMFHTLASCCANMLIGATPSRRSNQAWQQVYRSLEHGRIRSRCSNKSTMSQFPREIQKFAESLILMQRYRHSADYDPMEDFDRAQVRIWITEADDAIGEFESIDALHRRAFSAWVLFRSR